jgi:perosamine synthetase
MSEHVNVRAASRDDEEMFFHWRNLPWVVELGTTRRTVGLAEHHSWFSESLEGRRCLFVVEVDKRAAGTVRYDTRNEEAAEVSIYLMPEFTGRGIGTQAFLRSLPTLLSQQQTIKRLEARVLKANARSLDFFLHLGFSKKNVGSNEDIVLLTREFGEIPHSRPFVGSSEANAAAAVVASRQLAQGPFVHSLEERWCQLTSMTSAACVGSGLGALRLALLALGIGPGDEVIVPAYSCAAPMNAVLATGARPVLSDILIDDWTISPGDVERHITRRTKAVIAIHLFGGPAAVSKLLGRDVPVVEDCSHGIGGQCNGRPFGGSGTLSMSSFYATKMIAAGEGGIVAARDSSLIDRVRSARDYGDQLPSPHLLNDKLTDIEAAIALEQLKRLPEILSRRDERAKQYDTLLKPLVERGLIAVPHSTSGRVWYRYVVRLLEHKAIDVCRWMAAHHVHVEQPVWDLRKSELWSSELETTTLAFEHLISLPLYPDLDPIDQQTVCCTLTRCLESI